MNRSDRRITVGAIVVAMAALCVFWVAEVHQGSTRRPSHTSRPSAISYPSGPSHSSNTSHPSGPRPALFPFDPNTADSAQLLRLGLPMWQVRNICRYRERGGVYRRKEDFARVYGLTVKDYRRLAPYIRISADYRPAAEWVAANRVVAHDTTRHRGSTTGDTLRYPVKLRQGEQVELNSADTTALYRVPGIGRYYARQIIRYRQRLGGFASTEQLRAIEGLPDSVARYFSIDTAQVQRLNVNKLSLNELRRHPYINYYQAKAIVDYRRLHGPLRSLHDLSFCRDFTPEAIARLAPYVTF